MWFGIGAGREGVRRDGGWPLWMAVGLLLGSLPGCGSRPAPVRATRPVSADAVVFQDVAAASGLAFGHVTGGTGSKFMPETMGSGCGFLDFDGDGLLDVLLLSGRMIGAPALHGDPISAVVTPGLYHNLGGGRFEPVTSGSGLDAPLYAMGCAVADYDNDGRDDVYITCTLDASRLFHNEGGGRFRDVTTETGVGNESRWGAGAAWLDYDRDGRLDLFVCNYLDYSLDRHVRCTNRLGQESFCTPRHYEGLPSALYHNEGGGRFRDVSASSGIAAVTGKALGVTVCDVDRDGWPDLYVACDTTPNLYFRNTGKGRFLEAGVETGIAFAENGLARAGMGVDWAALGPKGELGIVVANYTNEPVSFFYESGKQFFVEQTAAAGLGEPTMLTLGFGAFFFDYDNDSRKDLFLANGHVQDDVHLFQNNLQYAQPHQLFRNVGADPATSGPPRFDEVTADAGPPFAVPRVSRGAAWGDYDNDGDLDILINNNGGAAELLRNDGGNRKHWLQVRLEGRRSNRNGVGAEVRVKSGGNAWRDVMKSGSSYCSASMLRVHFGLGEHAGYDRIEVVWPSGRTEIWPAGPADRLLHLVEGTGQEQTAGRANRVKSGQPDGDATGARGR